MTLIYTIKYAYRLCCRSFSVLVKDLKGKNHQITVLNLLHPIDEKDSYKKVYNLFPGQPGEGASQVHVYML